MDVCSSFFVAKQWRFGGKMTQLARGRMNWGACQSLRAAVHPSGCFHRLFIAVDTHPHSYLFQRCFFAAPEGVA